MDARAKCREEAHDCLLAEDLDFQKAASALLVAPVRWDARERLPTRQPQVALRKVVYSREPRPRVEPVRLRVVKQAPPGEWASARQVPWALRQLERPQALVVSEQSLEPQAKPTGSLLGALLELPV